MTSTNTRSDRVTMDGMHTPANLLPGWAADAACLDHPHPDWWYGQTPTGRHDTALFEHARQICRTCPVRSHCLIDALERGDDHGMWGATLPDERRRIARLARTLNRKDQAA